MRFPIFYPEKLGLRVAEKYLSTAALSIMMHSADLLSHHFEFMQRVLSFNIYCLSLLASKQFCLRPLLYSTSGKLRCIRLSPLIC